MNSKQLKRLIIVIFGLAFIGSTGIAVIGGFFRRDSNNAASDNPVTAAAPSATEQLQAQARGYAKVLEREPDNTTALIGLLQTSLQVGDLKTAVPPLKKLIELYPERTDLSNLLTEIETELAQRSQDEITPIEQNAEIPETIEKTPTE